LKKMKLIPVIPSQTFQIDEKDDDFLYYATANDFVTATFIKDRVILSLEYISLNYPSWIIYVIRPAKICANLDTLYERGWEIELKGIDVEAVRKRLNIPESMYGKIKAKIEGSAGEDAEP